MTRPACRVYLGFGSTWLTEPGSIVWTEVTNRVMDRRQPISTMRGSTAYHGEPDTGDLSLTLRNSDRHLDPLHTGGPHFGSLVPGVPVKVEGTPLGQSTVGVWWGTVKSWPQRYDRGNRIATVPVRAFDGFDKLARARIPRSPLEVEILADSPVAYWRLDEQTGDVMVDSSGNKHDGTYDPGTTALSALFPFGDVQHQGIRFDGDHTGWVSESTIVQQSAPFVIELLYAATQTSTEPGTLMFRQGTGRSPGGPYIYSTTDLGLYALTDSVADTTLYEYDMPGFVAPGTVARWASYRVLGVGNALLYVDGSVVDSVEGSSGGFTANDSKTQIGGDDGDISSAGFQGFICNVAVFAADIGASRIAAHYNAAHAPLDNQTTDARITWVLDQLGWPVGLRHLEVGKTTLGPATFKPGDGALDYLRLCAATEDGLLFVTTTGKIRFLDRYWRYTNTQATVPQITFTDNGSGISVSNLELEPADDELLVNVARFTRRGGTEQVAENTASRALYGEAGKRRTDLLHRTDVETRSQAEWTVATQGTPTPRIPSVTVNLHKLPPARQAQLLALDIGHRVRCTRTPQAVGAAFSIDLVVDGIKNSVTAAEWVMELFLSPAPDQTLGLLLWDTGLWDDADAVWAY